MNPWERTWFTPAAPVGLLAVRALTFTAIAVDVWLSRARFRRISSSAETIWEPVSLLGALHLGPPSAWLLDVLVWVALLGAVVAVVVPRSNASRAVVRWAAVSSAGAYAFLVLAANSLGKIDHDRQPLFILAVVLATAAVPALRDAPSWRHRWPVQAGRLALALMLLAAAWSKLSTSGVAWVRGPNMRNILGAESLIFRDPPLADLALWIAEDPRLWQLAALAAIAGEALVIGALLTDRQPLRALLALSGAGTLVGITLLMGLIGFPIVALTLTLFQLEKVPSPGRDRLRATALLLGAAAGLLAALRLGDGDWLTGLPVIAATAVALRGWFLPDVATPEPQTVEAHATSR